LDTGAAIETRPVQTQIDGLLTHGTSVTGAANTDKTAEAVSRADTPILARVGVAKVNDHVTELASHAKWTLAGEAVLH
jgi:hypothetical protein